MTITPDDEREAREWLQSLTTDATCKPYSARQAATILALLDAPRLPKPDSVPDWLLEELCASSARAGYGKRGMKVALQSLYDHYTAPPQPKKVEAWAIKAPNGSHEGVFIQRSDAERYLQPASGSHIVRLVEARDE